MTTKKKTIFLRVDEDLHTWLKQLCSYTDTSMNGRINEWLKEIHKHLKDFFV